MVLTVIDYLVIAPEDLVISSKEVAYATSSSYVNPATLAESAWSTSYPASLPEGTWLHTRTTLVYSDGNSTVTYMSSYVGRNGTSPIFADITNEHGGVVCDSSGNTTGGEQSVSTKALMYLGNTPQTLTGIVCKVDGTTLGTAYTDNADPTRSFRAVAYPSTGTITVYVRNGSYLKTKDVIITVSADINGSTVSKDLRLSISGSWAGSDGAPAVIYELEPSVDVVSRDSSGTPLYDTISFKVKKNVGGTPSEVSNWSTEGLTLYHNVGGSDISDGTVNGATKTISGIQSDLYKENSKVEWILKKGNDVVDREGIGSVDNGQNGSDGVSYEIRSTVDNVTIPANQTAATMNVTFSFFKKEADKDPEAYSCYYALFSRKGTSFSRLSYNTTKASSKSYTNQSTTVEGVTPDAFVLFIGKSAFSSSALSSAAPTSYLAKREIIINKLGDKGDKGDNAVAYGISLAGSSFYRDPNTETIYVNIKGKVYKVNGGSTSAYTALKRSDLSMYFQKTDGTTDPVPNVNSLADGYTVSGSTFASKFYNGSGYSDEEVFVVVLSVDGAEVARESIQIEKYGTNGRSIKGDTGRMYYLAGVFPDKAPYSRTSALCPVVYYGTEWWYLTADAATSSDVPVDGSEIWTKLPKFGVVITDAVFVKQFAQFGAAIITGDWLISCHGKIGNVLYGGSVEEPDNYNNRPAYTYFDPAYPQGFEPFLLSVINDEITTYGSEWTRITNNFRLVAGTYKFKIKCRAASTSDTIHLRLFYGDNSGDYYYLAGTTSDESVVLEITKTLSGRNDWNLRATTNADGDEGYIESIEIEPTDARFVPNFALDLKTGKTYQGDANIRGSITTIGPSSKVVISDGVIQFFGSFNFPNIVVGVDADGCAVLNFYDKSGNFKYGLGPDKIFESQSQAESMTLSYYNLDEGSTEASQLENSAIVTLYRFLYKNQTPAAANGIYKYLAKIVAGVYGPGEYCASQADAQKFNGKFIKYGYSASTKLKNSDVYGGGIAITKSRSTAYGIIKYLYNIESSFEDIDLAGWTVMQDSDFNRTVSDGCYYYNTKSAYNPEQAFYFDKYNGGAIGYSGSWAGWWNLNCCTDPADDETLIDPIYYFSLQELGPDGKVLNYKTLYINKSKLKAILQNAGCSL